MLELIFVYGTLKRGFPNNHVIADGVFVSEFVTTPDYTMVSLGSCPAVIQGGDTAIQGELWAVPSLHYTDILEGYPRFYNRTQIDTPYGLAWVYVLPYAGEINDENTIKDGYWAPNRKPRLGRTRRPSS